jgi:hypothetical protein
MLMSAEDIDGFIRLESKVWTALAEGDAAADAALLREDFMGVYPSGRAGRLEHAAQLEAGPSVVDFSILDPELRVLAEGMVLLTYLAHFTRPRAHAGGEAMYVTSIWKKEGSHWLNIFSQDTPLGDSRQSSGSG